jgi:hypothetical protein
MTPTSSPVRSWSGDGRKEAGANETSDGGPPAWALHVHGRLLELSGEVPQRGMLPAPQPFTHYLRNLSVQLTAAPTVAVRSAPIRKTVAPAPRAFGSKSRLVKLPQNPVGRPVVASTAFGPPNSSQPEPRQSGPATEQAGDSPASTHAAASDAAETEVDTTEWSSAQQSGPPRNAFVIRCLERVGHPMKRWLTQLKEHVVWKHPTFFTRQHTTATIWWSAVILHISGTHQL